MFLKNYKNLKKLSFYEFLILLFPICILSGSFITNLYLIFVSIFDKKLLKKKETMLFLKRLGFRYIYYLYYTILLMEYFLLIYIML